MKSRSKEQSAAQQASGIASPASAEPSSLRGEIGERGADDGLKEKMIRYQDGDSAAAGELIDLLSPRLLRYFAAWGILRDDAEDLLQECWMRIHRSRHTYRPSEPLLAWVYAVAHYTRLDGYRKRRRLQSREMLVDVIPESLQPAGSDRAAEGDFSQMLACLPESQREVILLLKESGLSLEEVARATSSSVGAVKQKAHRAYVKLRQVLEGKK